MNWNIFKRFEALETASKLQHEHLLRALKVVRELQDRLDSIERPRQTTLKDVETEVQRRLARAAYGRKYYAKKKAEKAVTEGGAA